MSNIYYHDVKSFMKIGKIDPNVQLLMTELENAIHWREWVISTIWRCDKIEQCDALIDMLTERKKELELEILMKVEELPEPVDDSVCELDSDCSSADCDDQVENEIGDMFKELGSDTSDEDLPPTPPETAQLPSDMPETVQLPDPSIIQI